MTPDERDAAVALAQRIADEGVQYSDVAEGSNVWTEQTATDVWPTDIKRIAQALVLALAERPTCDWQTRMCVNCGKTVPASHPRHEPLPECLGPDGLAACTFDMTLGEAWQHWRQKAHDARATIAEQAATIARLEGGDDPAKLWAEIYRLRAAVKGPDGYASWQDAATAERVRRVQAEAECAALRARVEAVEAVLDDEDGCPEPSSCGCPACVVRCRVYHALKEQP